MAYLRRYAPVGLERRGIRGAEDASGPVTYQSILGPLLVEMFDASLGIATVSGAVDTWTGQVGGRVVQAPGAGQRPVYAADGTRFSSKPVVQCAVTGSLCLRGVGLSQIFANTTRPWTYTVGRARNATPGAFSTLTDAGVNGVSDECTLRVNSSNQIEAFTSGIGSAVGPAADVARHSFQQYLDGTNLNLAIDNAVVGTFAAPGVNTFHAVTAIGVGCDASNPIHLCDATVALYLLCSAKPSAAQISAVEALSLAQYAP